MKQGDFVLVTTGVPGLNAFHVVGRVNCGAGVLLGAPHGGFVNLDVNMGGVHLPQAYREDECTPLRNLRHHGFCLTCSGWGLTSMFDNAPINDILDGNHGERCPDCGGSGRTGLSITVDREANSMVEAHVNFPADLHERIVCPDCSRSFKPMPNA